MGDDENVEGLAEFAERLVEQTETDLRSSSGTVRRRRRVVRGSGGALIPQDDGPEFVRVRSSAEETRTVARLGNTDPQVDEAGPEEIEAESSEEDPITPDQITASSGNSGHLATAKVVLDPTSAAMLIDAVRSYLDGHDRLGGEHPVTLDRRDRLRRAIALAESD